MAARREYNDARDEVALAMNYVDQDALFELLDLMGPQDDEEDAYDRLEELYTERPELAYRIYFNNRPMQVTLPPWEEFVDIWAPVIYWEAPYRYESAPEGKYTISQIVHRNYRDNRRVIPEPPLRATPRTKAARSSAREIRQALRMTNGDHRAAARLLFR